MAEVIISQTDLNPQRPYFTCGNNHSCNFFQWVDGKKENWCPSKKNTQQQQQANKRRKIQNNGEFQALFMQEMKTMVEQIREIRQAIDYYWQIPREDLHREYETKKRQRQELYQEIVSQQQTLPQPTQLPC